MAHTVWGHSICLTSSSNLHFQHSSTRRCPAAAARGDLPASTERALWLPGLSPPAHLDGSLAGDFGFDPLELGKDAATLKWYVQAELVHSRFAMAGVAGILFTDLLRKLGVALPVWYEAGATKFDLADANVLFLVQMILMGFVETKRYLDFVTPGSQAAEDTFFGFEAALEGLQPGYPGGPLFDPVGMGKDIANATDLKTKELKNGRLAMVAMLGFTVQAYVTKTGPVDNLLMHLSDPFHVANSCASSTNARDHRQPRVEEIST